MMKWCENHLNWVIILITIFAVVFGILLVEFSLYIAGYEYIPYPGQGYIPPNPWRIYESFTLNAILDIAIIISLPVYYWVAKKKRLNLLYLLFFLPPLVPTRETDVAIVFFTPFWIVGLILLLTLKNKSETQQTVKS
jgi:hypothetical protein